MTTDTALITKDFATDALLRWEQIHRLQRFRYAVEALAASRTALPVSIDNLSQPSTVRLLMPLPDILASLDNQIAEAEAWLDAHGCAR